MAQPTILSLKFTHSIGTPCGACTEVLVINGSGGPPAPADRATGEFILHTSGGPMQLALVVDFKATNAATIRDLRLEIFDGDRFPAMIVSSLPALAPGRTTVALSPPAPMLVVGGALPRRITRVRASFAMGAETGLSFDWSASGTPPTGTGG